MSNGICSTDAVISELRDKVDTAEKEIAAILGRLLPHIKVDSIGVYYNHSTSCGGSIIVTLNYRIQ